MLPTARGCEDHALILLAGNGMSRSRLCGCFLLLTGKLKGEAAPNLVHSGRLRKVQRCKLCITIHPRS